MQVLSWAREEILQELGVLTEYVPCWVLRAHHTHLHHHFHYVRHIFSLFSMHGAQALLLKFLLQKLFIASVTLVLTKEFVLSYPMLIRVDAIQDSVDLDVKTVKINFQPCHMCEGTAHSLLLTGFEFRLGHWIRCELAVSMGL